MGTTISLKGHPPCCAFVGLGSNLGSRRRTMTAAVERLAAARGVSVRKRTDFIETAPWGLAEQPPFLNAVAEIRTTLEPLPLLRLLKRIEVELGREPVAVRWGPRAIDLDILLFENLIVETEELKVPHPHLAKRRFVLEQLVELDNSLVHPKSKIPLVALLDAL